MGVLGRKQTEVPNRISGTAWKMMCKNSVVGVFERVQIGVPQEFWFYAGIL